MINSRLPPLLGGVANVKKEKKAPVPPSAVDDEDIIDDFGESAHCRIDDNRR